MKYYSKRIKIFIALFIVLLLNLLLPQITHLAQKGWSSLSGQSPAVPEVIDPLVEYFTSPTLFVSNHILAYYGHPNSKYMGILGRYSKTALQKKLLTEAGNYDNTNGSKGVVPALYVIYATVQPGGTLGYLNNKQLQSYIDFTYSNKMLLYLDHQIGKYGPVNALKKLLPFLKYPHVHLAIDPEWRTDRPMKVVGHVTGPELNQLQTIMHDYMATNKIKGIRQLVFHQFKYQMVRQRSKIHCDYSNVLLVHSTSGWGPPKVKRSTHKFNSEATNMPYKAFKLWYDPGMRAKGLHYDSPLMSPASVLSLQPQPGLIIYQ